MAQPRTKAFERSARQSSEPARPQAANVPPALARICLSPWWIFSPVVLTFYLWTATSGNRPFHPRDTSHEFYSQLTASLLQGRLHLATAPSPELLALPDPYDPAANETLRLHDASLYKGRYYLYFGIAPALTLYAPWRALTGASLSDDVAVALFCFGGWVFSCLLLFLLLDACGLRLPLWWQAAGVAVLALGQVAPMVLRRPRVYEVAVSAGYCFLLGGLYFLAQRILRGGARRYTPAVAAVLFGLAMGSRPHLALIAILVAVVYVIYVSRSDAPHFLIPLAAAFLLLAWYNYARFDNPFEFGLRYQTGAISFAQPDPWALRVRHWLASLYYFLICLPHVRPRFPFFELSGAALPFGNPANFPPGYYYEPIAGMFVVAPLTLAAVGLPFVSRKLPAPARLVLTILVVGAGATFAGMCLAVKGAHLRYELDFVPQLLIAGLCVSAWWSLRLPQAWLRRAVAGATAAACVWGVIAGLTLSINSYGYPLEQTNPLLFRSLASFFGAGPDAVVHEVESIHFDADVTFPSGKAGAGEVLFSSGMWEQWNLLLVRYEKETEGIFGFVNSGAGDTQTRRFPLRPGTPRRLTMDYTAHDRRLLLRLDDAVVLDHNIGYHPTARDQITIGRTLMGRFNVGEFTGKIALRPGGLVFTPRQ